jgi:hypothetical protein
MTLEMVLSQQVLDLNRDKQELLDALIDLFSVAHVNTESIDALTKARAAIAKATQ